jgi:hypothetical protein
MKKQPSNKLAALKNNNNHYIMQIETHRSAPLPQGASSKIANFTPLQRNTIGKQLLAVMLEIKRRKALSAAAPSGKKSKARLSSAQFQNCSL